MALLVVGFVVAFVVAAVAGVVALVRAGRREVAPSQAAEAARRHAGAVSGIALAGLLGGLLLGLVLVSGRSVGLRQGLYLGLVPALAGLLFAGVHAVGELTWPGPSGTLRRATLTRRTAADVAPGWLRAVTWAWAALTTATLALCGLAADDGGRGLTRTFTGPPDGQGTADTLFTGSSSASPFPGWFYGVPLLVAVVVVLLLAEGVLQLVARRPAVMDTAPQWDLALRRLSAHRLLRGVQLVLGWTAAGVLLYGGRATSNVATSAFGIDDVMTTSTDLRYAIVGGAMIVLGLAVGLGATAVAFLRGAPAAAPLPQPTAPPLGAAPA